jgi:hypothetical protein
LSGKGGGMISAMRMPTPSIAAANLSIASP